MEQGSRVLGSQRRQRVGLASGMPRGPYRGTVLYRIVLNTTGLFLYSYLLYGSEQYSSDVEEDQESPIAS